MMKSSFWTGLLYLTIWELCYAQEYSKFPQSLCINPSAITASGYGKCDSIYSEFIACGSTATIDRAAGASCLCRQEIVNGIFDCESEKRFCDGMSTGDTWLDIIDTWHSKCDTKITFTPTTPVLSTYSRIDFRICNSAWDGCVTESAERSKCRSYTADERELRSCLCKTKVVAAAFTCSYVGNVSCLMSPGTVSAVRGYSYCPNFLSIIRPLVNATSAAPTLPLSQTTASLLSLSQLTASLTVTKPALPGESQSLFGPSATQESRSGAAVLKHDLLVGLFFGALGLVGVT